MADPNNIQADVAYRTAVAERGKFFPVDEDYLTSVGYPASGEGKYAILTYSINSASTSGGSGGGDGTIVDGVDPSIKATVFDLLNANGLATVLIDANGDQITSFGSSAIAEAGTPSAVPDGDPVNPWYDTFGRQVIYGANMSTNSLDVSVINNPIISRLGPIINLNAVTADTDGVQIDVSAYHNVTIHIKAVGASVNATVDVEHSMTGAADEWVNIASETLAVSGMTEVAVSQQAYRYMRTKVSAYTSGTITTTLYAGN
jgi:hypothetical protein